MTKLLASALLAALLALPAAATPSLVPPLGLHAEPGPGGSAVLAWMPPPTLPGSQVSYAIYADGTPLAVVDQTRYAVPAGAPVLYTVTALVDGSESPPAATMVGEVHAAPGEPYVCPPLITSIYSYPPFVAVGVDYECILPQ